MMRPGDDDTIAALATARGTAALAIVRMTGPRSILIADACFDGRIRLTDADTHSAHVGWLRRPDDDAVDQVVMTVFRSPASATGEDVVECSCHGGALIASRVLQAFYDGGASPARAGAFTERAFVNGKLDLAQAEAVADLIHASSSAAARVSVRQLEGRFSDLLDKIREELLDLTAFVELELDFSDEDVAFVDRDRLGSLLSYASSTLQRLLDTGRLGSLVRDGVRITIAGRPNVGKSTLLNALAGMDRAIVSDTPGTTRDVLHASVEISGLRFRFADTAGLREADDQIEQEGVRRAEQEASEADAVIYVVDAATGMSPEEESRLATWRERAPVVVVANKSDLLSGGVAGLVGPEFGLPGDCIFMSAREGLKDGTRLAPLESALLRAVDIEGWDAETLPVMVNARHAEHLRRAIEAVQRASAGLDAGTSGDLLSIDLRIALSEIGSITGAVTNEEVLGRIFSRFCIGK